MRITVLSVLCAVVFLIACGGGGKSRDAAESSDSLIGKAEADIFNETGYPIVNEPITLKTIYAKQPTHGDLDKMPSLKTLQEVSGITLEIEQIPGFSYNEKVNLMFASGDLPDFIPSWGPESVASYTELLSPLDDYIDSYMPNLLAIFEKRPAYRKILRLADGNIYQLPMIGESLQYETPYHMFINKKWLDNLGMPVPVTTEEFYQSLKAFKEKDPNGNGKSDEIPITFTGTGEFELVGAFTFPFSTGDYLKVNSDGILEFVPLTEAEGFQDFVEWWQRIYQEGLVDPELYVLDGGSYYAKGKTDPIGGFREWYDENIVGNENVDDYVMVSPLKGPSGLQLANRAPYLAAGSTFFLSAANPYPASTMRLMDMGYTPEYAWQIIFGPWGITLEKLPDGTIGSLTPPEGLSDDEWRYEHTVGYAWPYALLSDEMDKYTGPQSYQRKAERRKVLDPYLPPADAYVPPLNFTFEESAELATLNADIGDFITQQYTDWVTQGTDVRAAWPEFAAQLERIGVKRYVEIRQAAYDRFMSE